MAKEMSAVVTVLEIVFARMLNTYTAEPVKVTVIDIGVSPARRVFSCQVLSWTWVRSKVAGLMWQAGQFSEGEPAFHESSGPATYCGAWPVVGSPDVSSTVMFTRRERTGMKSKDRKIKRSCASPRVVALSR